MGLAAQATRKIFLAIYLETLNSNHQRTSLDKMYRFSDNPGQNNICRFFSSSFDSGSFVKRENILAELFLWQKYSFGSRKLPSGGRNTFLIFILKMKEEQMAPSRTFAISHLQEHLKV